MGKGAIKNETQRKLMSPPDRSTGSPHFIIMEKQKQFKKLWEDFLKGKYSKRSPERLDRESLARMFFEFGYSRGLLYE